MGSLGDWHRVQASHHLAGRDAELFELIYIRTVMGLHR